MSEWINVKEKEYPCGGLIFCLFSHLKQKKFSVYLIVTDEGIYDVHGDPIDESEYEITHWMPLPNPPEKQK